ncbi:hypothetical protein GEMRC1_001245 [Eukaryota sp. GEM-RC1]
MYHSVHLDEDISVSLDYLYRMPHSLLESPSAIALINVDGSIADVFHKLAFHLDTDVESLKSLDIHTLFPDFFEASLFTQKLKQSLSHSIPMEAQIITLQSPIGVPRTFLINVIALNSFEALIVFNNVKPLPKEAQIATSSWLMEKFLSLCGVSTFIYNPSHDSFYVDDRYLNLFESHVAVPETLQDFMNHFDSNHRTHIQQQFDDVLNGVCSDAVFTAPFLIKNKTQLISCQAYGAQINGQTIRVFGVIKPTAETPDSKQHELEFREKERLLKTLDHKEDQLQSLAEDLEGAQRLAKLGFWRFYCNERVFSLTKLAQDMHGLHSSFVSFDELRNKLVPEHLAQWDSVWHDVVEGKEFPTFDEHRYTFHDPPRLIWVRKSGRPTKFDENGKVLEVTGVMTDLTELKDAISAADQANKAKSLFLATISHEIRTPLNSYVVLFIIHLSIIGLLSLFDQSTDLSDESQRILEIVNHSSSSLLSIITNILDFTRIESGRIALDQTEFHLPSIVDHVVEMHSDIARSKISVELLNTVDPVCDVMVTGDCNRLQQILINLVSNALKFTHDGYVRIQLRKQSIADGNLSFTLACHDTGIGISTEDLGKLFTVFTQANAHITTKYGGSGLGLAISGSLARMMGSNITVRSKEGKGSVFKLQLTLPLVHPHEAATPTYFRDHQCFVFSRRRPLPCYLLAQLRLMRVKCYGFEEPTRQTILNRITAIDTSLQQYVFVDHEVFSEFIPLIKAGFEGSPVMVIDPKGFYDEYFTVHSPITYKRVKQFLSGRKRSTAYIHHSQTPVNGGQFSILVADDHPLNRKVISLLLVSMGCVVTLVDNGDKAAEKYRENPSAYDLVCLDYRMPYSGTQAAKDIRRHEGINCLSEVKILCLTGDASIESRYHTIESGMNSWMAKPVSRSALITELDHLLPRSTRRPFRSRSSTLQKDVVSI